MLRSLLRLTVSSSRTLNSCRTFTKCSTPVNSSKTWNGTVVLSQVSKSSVAFKLSHFPHQLSSCSFSTTSGLYQQAVEGEQKQNSSDASVAVAQQHLDVLESEDSSLLEQTVEEVESNWFDPMVFLIHRLHESTGLPWFALLAGMTWSIRLLMLPLTLGSLRTSALMNSLQPQLRDIQEKISRAKERGNSEKLAEYNKKYMEILRVNKVNPLKALFAPLAQAPVFVSFFFSLRKLSTIEPSFVDGGALWFQDLSSPDPYYILPVMCSGILLTTLQFGGETASTATSKTAFNMMRLMALSIIPFTYHMPSALFCYWVPNNLFSLCQTLLFKVSKVRKILKLPEKKRGSASNANKKSQDEQTTFDHLYSQAGSKAEREALAALSYNTGKQGTNPILEAAKQGMKPRLLDRKRSIQK
eukprot:jgi/Galph1/4306/GphlegSOOS_G2948.1